MGPLAKQLTFQHLLRLSEKNMKDTIGKLVRTTICGLVFGIFVTPIIVSAQMPNSPPDEIPVCHDDTNPCSGDNVWIGSGCSGHCGLGSTEHECCGYNLWKCVGSSTVFYTRTCNVVAKVYCTYVNGGNECFIAPVGDPPL